MNTDDRGRVRVMQRPEATLVEVFPDRPVDGGARAFALAHLEAGPGPVLWAQDRLTRRETGEPYLPGLPPGLGLIRADLGKPADVLWAMEQALACADLGGVLGEVWGEASAIDFTATKRLVLRAEARGIPCWLIRRAARADLSAARERWRIASRPSPPPEDDAHAPGMAAWRATLFRARSRAPGTWDIFWSPATGRRAIPRPEAAPGIPAAAPMAAPMASTVTALARSA